ncbi:PAS domain S-box protein [Magnetovibrio sp. PR-2]|uniref:PAS domain S-box protein n=1 Tax=Magnetovibrio sp. PR-2 TaxID=3120356 RepID=UPI002FCE2529
MSSKKSPVIATNADALPKKRIKMPPRPDSPEQRLHDIVSTVGDWIWETNEILEITFISDRFLETTGHAPEVLVNKTLQQVVLGDDMAGGDDNPVIFNLDNREPFRDIACSLEAADGQILHFTLSGIPFYSDNNMFRGYRGAAHNITPQLEAKRKFFEAQKLAQNATLAEASKQTSLRFAAEAAGMDAAFVIYDADGNLTAASEEYAKLYPALDDLIIPGATLKDILQEAASRLDIKEAQGRIEDWVSEKLEERLHPKPLHQEIYRGGRWWRIQEQRTRDGQVISLHTDITHIKDMEATLLDSETRYRKLVEMAPDLTCVVTDGLITLMNGAGATMLGEQDANWFIGKKFEDFLHPDFRSIVRDDVKELFDEHWTPMRIIRVDGTAMDAELAALPFSDRGLQTVMLVARDTSERKRAAEALINRDFQLQGIMDTVVDGIITIDEAGMVQSFNRSAERIFGYDAQEVLQRNVSKLMPKQFADNHDSYIQRYKETGQAGIIGTGRETIATCKDGSEFPIDLAISELKRDGRSLFIGVVRDITDRKAAEDQLQESQERYALAIRGAGEGIFDWDVTSDQLYISSQICELTGYNNPFIKADLWLGMINPDDRPTYHEKLIAHLKGFTDNFSHECRLRHKDGSERWIRISGKAISDKAGYVYRMAGSVGDITERIQARHQLIDAKERAEIANRVKTEFLANMSHELRTPLNAIIGFSDVMLAGLFGPLEARYGEYIENIRDSGSHLLDVINDILDVSRIEAGQMELHPERAQVDDLIHSATRLVQDRARSADLELKVKIADGLPDLMVDPQRIKQVLLNLLSNAVKFTPENGQVTVTARQTVNDELVIAVADTGIGMHTDDIVTALTPFGQVDSKLTRKYEGTGLGLPLTKSFVELHDAHMDIVSEPNLGTTVSIHFPASRLVL